MIKESLLASYVHVIQVFDLYGVGSRKTFSTPNLAKELNLKVSALSESFL